MSTLRLTHPSQQLAGNCTITGSKSESNRLLILQALFPALELQNLSNSDDTQAMARGLSSTAETIDIGHAGTTMRFLTSYFATTPGTEKILTGSKRMQERPIKILVDALRAIGADIEYVKNEGYPPLRISGKKITVDRVELAANVSSQYITSLMLIAPKLPKGLTIHLVGEITSIPYINMTCSLLQKVGVQATFEGQTIQVFPQEKIMPKKVEVESDWSSASYHFSMAALADNAQISIKNYISDSLQGDSVLVEIYKQMGVSSSFDGNTLHLKNNAEVQSHITLDLVKAPDIAQTIAVTCFGLGISCDLTGLHTLKIKETDRLVALDTELSKLGADIRVTNDSLHLAARKKPINENVAIDTYHDHRMAMAFAPLGIKVPIYINEADVVSKSYPTFWNDLRSLGFSII
ncbi:MAG: 3-phosphoshikimate 1-carboxyvinyltransferase [Bacteroidetes bacterium]|nr:3-phosphoshikimate 1-carboxyvinyltransferase [Bacteroidota bacterium]MDA0888819.1 3-phosphoshikimate 1-carboxyvinyltransferase [Bacteroidota bacterium]MDA1084582.1 3-phosphoshikimate 1-carboxyvinyltransferase [Bacteroidota bacterium]